MLGRQAYSLECRNMGLWEGGKGHHADLKALESRFLSKVPIIPYSRNPVFQAYSLECGNMGLRECGNVPLLPYSRNPVLMNGLSRVGLVNFPS